MDQYGDTLFGIVLKIVGEQQLAEEALQEGFVKVWKIFLNINLKKHRCLPGC